MLVNADRSANQCIIFKKRIFGFFSNRIHTSETKKDTAKTQTHNNP